MKKKHKKNQRNTKENTNILVTISIIILLILAILVIYGQNVTNNKNTISINTKYDINTTIQEINNTKEIFSIIVLPDTQKEVQDYPEVYFSQINWIVDNKDVLNIKAVIHVGDMVNVPTNKSQWETFNSGILLLDEINMPILTSLGNHDHPSTIYDEYFPASRYSHTEWWGENMINKGNAQDTDNKYITITANNEEYILINTDYCPTTEEISWANTMLEKNKEKKAILSTHAYLDKNAQRSPHVCKNTTYIWNDLITKHENLQVVVCGHVHSEAKRTDSNNAGKQVYQMLADYQEEKNGGNGWVRILTFNPNNDTISVTTYSPFLQQIRKGDKSNFLLEYEMN